MTMRIPATVYSVSLLYNVKGRRPVLGMHMWVEEGAKRYTQDEMCALGRVKFEASWDQARFGPLSLATFSLACGVSDTIEGV